MKYLAVLAIVAIVYVVLSRQTPVAQVTEAVAQTEVQPLTQGGRDVAPAMSTALKRPLDRTNAVLQQVQDRNGAGEF